ncbi:MAG: helix-turn-helix domain-containing protein [Nocardioidaceae bacterium]
MIASVTDQPGDRRGSLGDLLTVLEAIGLRLVSHDHGRALAAERTVLFDPRGVLEPTPGGLLLAVGVPVRGAGGAQVVSAAAEHGYSAVVVKAYGEEVDPLARVADEHGIALLAVHDDVAWLSLDSHLNNALVSATRIGRSLSSIAVGDLFSLAGAIADTVGGATAIEDFGQRILAYSSSPEHPIDVERRDGILGRQVPDLPANAAQYRKLYHSPGPVRFPATPDGFARLAVAVRAGTEQLGSIWVVVDREQLGAPAAEALEAAASVAALHLLRARSSEDLARQQRAEAARRLLESAGDPVDAAAALGLEASGPFAVLAFAPAELDEALALVAERLAPMITLRCDARLGRTGSVLTDGALYVVASGSQVQREATLRSVAEEVVVAARTSLRLRVLVGIADTVQRPSRVASAGGEASRLLALLRRRPDLGPVATAGRLSDQMVLSSLTEALAADDRLVPARARAILAHDARHGTDYSRLLLTHLDHARDAGRTAGALAVHPNTVRYRLRRAAELFDLDLGSADQVLPLWLALRARPDSIDRPDSFDRPDSTD